MTWAVRCSECAELVWPPLDACGSGGRSEIAALRLALEHVRESRHTDVEPIAGAHYVGEGTRPEDFGDGVTVADCVTPPRGKVVSDLEFAVETLRDQADRFERWVDEDEPELAAEILVDDLRERADLLERKQRERAKKEDTCPACGCETSPDYREYGVVAGCENEDCRVEGFQPWVGDV